MKMLKHISALAASTALIMTGAMPAMAAQVPSATVSPAPIDMASLEWNTDGDKVEGWRGYRGHRRHRNRVDGGDILAGILVIGGIAAIASAASKNKRERHYDDRDYRYDDRRDDNRRYDDRQDNRSENRGTGGMDQAIRACSSAAARQAGRDASVSAIQSVARDGAGWRVEGELSNSDQPTFLCGATDGRVDFVQLGNGGVAFRN